LRDGQTTTVQMPANFGSTLASGEVQKKQLMQPRTPFEIAEVSAGSPAEKAKLQPGDRIVGLNGQPIAYFDQFQVLANQNKGKSVTLQVLRGQDTVAAPLTLTESGTIGVRREVMRFLHMQREKTSLAGAIPAGWEAATSFLSDQVKAFGQMFKGKIKASENLGGFISIGKLFPSEWGDWETFWRMTASLSIMLAFINLLPIPALDGGYVVFLLWEVVTGKRVSDKFMERAVTFGFFLLLALMIYTNGLDVWRSWIK
ncbi:MAG: M50 family metallopeptidase, partial [Saprospiraceae bacterium]